MSNINSRLSYKLKFLTKKSENISCSFKVVWEYNVVEAVVGGVCKRWLGSSVLRLCMCEQPSAETCPH